MDRRHFLGGMTAASVVASIGIPARAAQPAMVASRVALLGPRVVVGVKIGTAAPEMFMIDTGAAFSLIDRDYAKELKLDLRQTSRIWGIGGMVEAPIYLARDVSIGSGVRQGDVIFAGIEGRGFGPDIRGTLGAGMLTALDSDLDLEAGEWRVYPDGRPERRGLVAMDNAIVQAREIAPRLYVDAVVNGRKLRFLVDTGAPGALSLGPKAGKALGLWNDDRPYAPQMTRGIGGPGGIGRLVRGERITLAGIVFDQPILLLRPERERPDADGIIGLDLLRNFNLSTEVKAKRLWLQRHRQPSGLANDYGRSGLWLGADGRIAAVGTGSPAARAGVKVGERVVGEPVPRLVGRLGGEAGTTVVLRVANGSAERPVELVLADYL